MHKVTAKKPQLFEMDFNKTPRFTVTGKFGSQTIKH